MYGNVALVNRLYPDKVEISSRPPSIQTVVFKAR